MQLNRFRSFIMAIIIYTLTASCIQVVESPTPTKKPDPTKTRTSTRTPTRGVTEVVPPTPTEEKKHSVFLISWDGAGADVVNELIEEGVLPNFENVANRGVQANYARTIDPSLTAPAQNSISSGALPEDTGIVSNAFHNSNDSFYWYRLGFLEPMQQAEPVWVTASRAGLTTAAVFFPGGSPSLPNQMADYTVGYGIRDAYSNQVTVSLMSASQWDASPTSYSPLLESSYLIPEVAHIYMLVLDTSDDEVINYDAVIISTEKSVPEDALTLRVNDWGEMIFNESTMSGADLLIQEINNKSVTFFHTAVYHNTASPRELLEEINQRFSHFPPGADEYALQHGWISAEDYVHMLERASLWKAEVAAWVYEEYHPDLLFTWQEMFDAAGHAFYLRDPRQKNFSSEMANIYDSHYRRCAQIANRSLGLMIENVDTENTNILLVSDHGMAPVHTNININTVLEHAGLLTLDSRDYVVVDESRALAVASGGSANIYINLEGRQKSGIVAESEYGEVQQEVIDLLLGLIDPDTGQKVLQRIIPRETLSNFGLNHPHTGDVFVQAEIGYNLDGWRGKDEVFSQSEIVGQHGYDSGLNDMHAIFIAAGPDIQSNGGVIAPVSVLDYAPTIAAVLGIEPHPAVVGEPISSFFYP